MARRSKVQDGNPDLEAAATIPQTSLQAALEAIPQDKIEKGEKARVNTMIFIIKVCKPSFSRKMREDEVEIKARAAGIELPTIEGEPKPKAKLKKGKKAAQAELAGIDESGIGEMDSENVELTINYSMLNLSKSLLTREALRPIRALDTQFKRFIQFLEVKTGLVGGGKHVIPFKFVDELDAECLKYIEKRWELINKFLEEYEAFKREAAIELGELYKEADYPTAAAVRSAFAVTFAWKVFDVPQALKGISMDIMRREMAKVKVEWAAAGDEMRDGLRAGLWEMLELATDRLGYESEGEPRRFADSLVKKVNRFLETFDGRNLVGDDETAKIIGEVRAAMAGIDSKALRDKDSTEVRDELRAKLEAIKAEMIEGELVPVGRRLKLREVEECE